MFYGTYDRASRADRYYLRIADEYMVRVDREVRGLQREGLAALTRAADEPRSLKDRHRGRGRAR
jgi:hypothetical protein